VASEQHNISINHLLHMHSTQQTEALKTDFSNLIFAEPRAKRNRQYYREVLVLQKLLSVICSNSKTMHHHIMLMTVNVLCLEHSIH